MLKVMGMSRATPIVAVRPGIAPMMIPPTTPKEITNRTPGVKTYNMELKSITIPSIFVGRNSAQHRMEQLSFWQQNIKHLHESEVYAKNHAWWEQNHNKGATLAEGE